VFSTRANNTTRENIANVFSAKSLQSLLELDLKFELQPSTLPSQSARNWSTQNDISTREIKLVGHISRPVVGEGRQTPDRQMFFVNSRPCGLPQVAKAINEVYRSYNVTQSPFIFANIILDTNAYDVNVSPDKRTILLHDQAALLEALKSSLIELFESHEQSVPQNLLPNRKLPTSKSLTVRKELEDVEDTPMQTQQVMEDGTVGPPASLLRNFVGRQTVTRDNVDRTSKRESVIKLAKSAESKNPSNPTSAAVRDFHERLGMRFNSQSTKLSVDVDDDVESVESSEVAQYQESPVEDEPQLFNRARQDSEGVAATVPDAKTPSRRTATNVFERLIRPRPAEDTAIITIGDKTTTTQLGTPPSKRQRTLETSSKAIAPSNPILIGSLRSFAAPGTLVDDVIMDDIDLVTVEGAEEVDVLPKDKNRRTRIFPSSESLDPRQFEEDDEPDTNEQGEKETDEDDVSQASIPSAQKSPVTPLVDQIAQETEDEDSGDEYVDEARKKVREEAKVAKMIEEAEERVSRPTVDNVKRAISALKARSRKDSTIQLLTEVSISEKELTHDLHALEQTKNSIKSSKTGKTSKTDEMEDDERLALSVSKADFSHMSVIGQFNLGFIIAKRPTHKQDDALLPPNAGRESEEMFIIDQHASDEKYNFERLQTETIVQNQRLVHPKTLDLTAVEEEIILSHPEALSKNGFVVSVDQSGTSQVGRRCKLVSLPMSKEVVFDSQDLEELLALLSDHAGSEIPRPSKVRRMFAMRACRSSIMVGKTLTNKQMTNVIRHMGQIDKPWNCPHGRPTMRHLFGLDSWSGWQEGDGIAIGEKIPKRADWNAYLRRAREDEVEEEEAEAEEEDEVGEKSDGDESYL
jgi:DNA mismatch repair protein PMS2